MKKAFATIQIKVPNNFDAGECERCPLREEEDFYEHPCYTSTKITCGIGYTSKTCPLEFERKEI